MIALPAHKSGFDGGLLVILGVGALAAVLLMNGSSKTLSEGGSSGETGGPLYQGADSTSGYPTIYQIPADSFAGFPESNNLDLSALLKLLSPGETAPDTTDTTKKMTAVKSSALDAGATYLDSSGNVQTLPTPYLSNLSAKKTTTVGDATADLTLKTIKASNPGFGFLGLDSLITALTGGVVNSMVPNNNAGVASTGGAVYNGADSTADTKKSATIAATQGKTWNGEYIYNQNSVYDARGNILNGAEAQKATDIWMNWISGDSNVHVYDYTGTEVQKWQGMVVDKTTGMLVASKALDAGAAKQAVEQAGLTKKEASIAASSGAQSSSSKAATPAGGSGSGGGSYASRSGWVKSSSGAMVH